ncbi:MAG: hypothetical protein UZ21_OP11001000595 [Microgenomates bacterium OLB22]|nr:MAG: hypothetical protein UZ21_OP11001000595 [Microgenomates bacterium OLB22]
MREVYISVDVETDGPIPGDYSLLSIGACVVYEPDRLFYITLKPLSTDYLPDALAVSGLDRDRLMQDGIDPSDGIKSFVRWVRNVSHGARPVFVGFNATFDWMFIHWYCIHFAGMNPFGIAGWDIKAYYAGLTNVSLWADAGKKKMDPRFLSALPHTHNALDDAKEQAEMFRKLRDQARSTIPHNL